MESQNTLELLDFISPEGILSQGLVPVRGRHNIRLSIDEKVAISVAKTFIRIDYVLFRRFSDGRSSQIAAYIIDNSNQKLSEPNLAELHRQIWLNGGVPLLYIAWPSRIDILSCARGPVFWHDNECRYSPEKQFYQNVLEPSIQINDELQRFSAYHLADGTFWDEPRNNELIDYGKSAHKLLIQQVVYTDASLNGAKNHVLRRLLLLTILIKYLEDRHVFPPGWFSRYHRGAKDFIDVLEGGEPSEVYRLMKFFEHKFNGDVFSLDNVNFEYISGENLKNLANLVDCQTIGTQRCLWRMFSFEHIPVEIISSIHQRFVEDGRGAVYTPPFLASLLLDYTLPYRKIRGNERILDPACGSGIFLVEAFRRLVNVWQRNHGWKRPNVNVLKTILRQSIFGIDIDRDAVDLAVFSMCLAICDALQPDVIWRELKFDKLRSRNLIKDDFFHIISDHLHNKVTIIREGFDIIIGNPPFTELSDNGFEINKYYQQRYQTRQVLPDKQAAYLFLEQSFSILKKGGRVCLIQPSGFIYKSGTRKFRTSIQKEFKIDTVFDFTSIRNLYGASDTKTIAILASSNKPNSRHTINHWTFRRTASVHQHLCFELDHYDRHIVTQSQAQTDFYIWRINLLGGGRLVNLSNRLRELPTLLQFIDKKKWDYGEGYIAGGEKVKRKPAPFLTGKPLLPTEAIGDEKIDTSKITLVKEIEFRSAYTESRYTPPLILIKESESLPIHFWNQGFIAYKAKTIGISADISQISEFNTFFKSLISNKETFRFYCTLHSTQSLIDKATVLCKQDLDALPFPEDMNNLSLSFWEKALCEDTNKYMTEYIRLGQNSSLLSSSANKDDLQLYSDMFIRLLGSIYDNLRPSEPYFLNGLICQPFYFGEKPDFLRFKLNAEEKFRKLIYTQDYHSYLRTIRVIRLYADNFLILIKPDRLRYWIRSTAIRDADETIVDLRKQGY